MTAAEMNAHRAKKLGGLIIAAWPLSGCALGFDPTFDQTSPLAPEAAAAVAANRAYPRWRDFPSAPQDVPAPDQVGGRVVSLGTASGALAGEVARIDWTLSGDPEAYAARTRAEVQAVPVSPDAQRTQTEVEAFAQALRDRAKAPPPVDRRAPRP